MCVFISDFTPCLHSGSVYSNYFFGLALQLNVLMKPKMLDLLIILFVRAHCTVVIPATPHPRVCSCPFIRPVVLLQLAPGLLPFA